MSSLETIRDTLKRYQERMAAHQAGEDVDLLPVLQELAALSRNPPPDADPRLQHFLERQSYAKAWQYLQAD